ncbi:SIMPL domain-containing protein [Hyphomicrobium sp.]|uniref:SIMPL domain-containing protein n=1 Tax=Hyphomicrobium sp. TaxID=82 RepID=UPI002D7836A8|nr:SIMPL domain-containing protein [Hyphomicrobium sp.]HET6388214.1 SIMPL domain-containing protein [Hyphomicrobium sp.]
MQSAPRSRYTILLLNIALAAGCLMTQAPALRAEERPMERTITVSATGTAQAEPDRARITSGVTTEAATAREALSANSVTMNKVITQLKTSGIEPKDIQTAAFNVEPVMDYSKDGQPPVLRGYRVSNQVVVYVRDLAKLGEILDQVVSAGANQIQGLAFEVSKEDELKDEARKGAVANALRRAKLLAAAAGAEVGNVMQISEETVPGGPVPYGAPRLAKAAAAAPIEVGTSTLEARVTITWALK